jgi:hypothetical protein
MHRFNSSWTLHWNTHDFIPLGGKNIRERGPLRLFHFSQIRVMDSKEKKKVKDQDQEEDYNDEKQRIDSMTLALSQDCLSFPKDVAKIISQYCILLNLNFAPEFAKVVSELIDLGLYNKYIQTRISMVHSSHPLSQSVHKWTIETQATQEWRVGLHHKDQHTILELSSSFCTNVQVKKMSYPVTHIYEHSLADDFSTAGSFVTLIINLDESSVYAQCGKHGIAARPPTLIWYGITNLSEFIPFYRFKEITNSTGFRVIS